ncbi:hypothetical protein DFJ73DRAFT_766039 [Zopfochytrium polystomum]|nr:hypothetical protein DFJ73DRAFT_766039 [Zopfochytrium polystomum]
MGRVGMIVEGRRGAEDCGTAWEGPTVATPALPKPVGRGGKAAEAEATGCSTGGSGGGGGWSSGAEEVGTVGAPTMTGGTTTGTFILRGGGVRGPVTSGALARRRCEREKERVRVRERKRERRGREGGEGKGFEDELRGRGRQRRQRDGNGAKEMQRRCVCQERQR